MSEGEGGQVRGRGMSEGEGGRVRGRGDEGGRANVQLPLELPTL